MFLFPPLWEGFKCLGKVGWTPGLLYSRRVKVERDFLVRLFKMLWHFFNSSFWQIFRNNAPLVINSELSPLWCSVKESLPYHCLKTRKPKTDISKIKILVGSLLCCIKMFKFVFCILKQKRKNDCARGTRKNNTPFKIVSWGCKFTIQGGYVEVLRGGKTKTTKKMCKAVTMKLH